MAPPRLDWPGAVLVACGLAGSAYALIQSSELGWADPTVLLAAAAGVLGIGAFMVVEAVSAAPMVPLDLFRSRRFSGINLLTLFLYAALAGGFFLLPFDLIRAQGYSAAEAGAASLPVPLLLTALSRWSGGLLDRLGDRPPLIIGPLVTAAGFLFLAVKGTDGLYWSSVFPAMMIIGIGMAVSVAPLTAAVMSAVPERQVGVASGVNNAVADIAALLAVSVFGVIALAVFGHVLDRDIAGLGASVDVAQAAAAIGKTLGGSNLPVSLPVDQRAALEGAIAAAFSATFRIVMLGTAGLAALSAACAAAMVAAKSR